MLSSSEKEALSKVVVVVVDGEGDGNADGERGETEEGDTDCSNHSDRQLQQHQQQQEHRSQQDQNQDDDNKPKRNPFCSRCRNHGKKAQVKGHKRHCEYRDCQCEGCKLVEWRQIVSARQIKRRRYQKQDEECGRSIEVSPPVLTRDTNSDLAALIQKTLIGTPTSRHLPSLHATAYNNKQQAHGQHRHQQTASQSGQSPEQAAAVAAQQHQINSASPVSAAMSNALHLFNFSNTVQPSSVIIPPPVVSTGETASPLIPNLREQMTLVDEIYSSFGPLAIFAWLKAEQFDARKVHDIIRASQASYSNLLDLKSKYNLHNNYEHHHPHHPQQLQQQQQQQQITLAINSSTGNGRVVSGACLHNNNIDISISDKIKRQEANQGSESQSPINSSEVSCNNSNSSSNNNNSSIATNSNQLLELEQQTTKSASHIPKQTPMSSCSSSVAINSTNYSSSTISSTPSPLYTIGNSFSNNSYSSASSSSNNTDNITIYTNNNSSSRNTTAVDTAAAAAVAAAAHHQHNMSLASTLNSLPMSTAARGLLWPSLKMPTGSGVAAAAAAAAASVMHPHHFLPHFMHHPFGAHHQHHYLQQVSPAQLSAITNLSPTKAASSSSTVL